METNNDLLKKKVTKLAKALVVITKPSIEDVIREKFESFSNILVEQIKPWIEEVSKDNSRLNNAFKLLNYYYILDKINWPVFLIRDNEFINKINELKKENKLKQIDDYIMEYLDDERIDSFVNYINSIEKNQLKNRLVENSINLYKNGEYYGCTALLICELNGLVNDIFSINQSKESNEVKKTKIQNQLKRSGRIEKNTKGIRLKSEKNRIVWAFNFIDEDAVCWQVVTKYLYEIVYTSDKEYSQDDPCRNKICHGEQVDYGTKKHALKSILIIYTLYHLKEEHIKKL